MACHSSKCPLSPDALLNYFFFFSISSSQFTFYICASPPVVMKRSIMKDTENVYLSFGASAFRKQIGYFRESLLVHIYVWQALCCHSADRGCDSHSGLTDHSSSRMLVSLLPKLLTFQGFIVSKYLVKFKRTMRHMLVTGGMMGSTVCNL